MVDGCHVSDLARVHAVIPRQPLLPVATRIARKKFIEAKLYITLCEAMPSHSRVPVVTAAA
jgi:hypothetical protein